MKYHHYLPLTAYTTAKERIYFEFFENLQLNRNAFPNSTAKREWHKHSWKSSAIN